MDEGKEQDCIFEEAAVVDSYRIDLWPVAKSTGDQVVRQRGGQAAYWHASLER